MPNPPASLTIPTPTSPIPQQTSSPSPTSPLLTMSFLLSCFEPHLFSSLPAPPDLSVTSLSQLSSLPHLTHTRGGAALRMKSLGHRVPGEVAGTRAASTYRSQGAPSPRCCHRAWCVHSDLQAGLVAQCGAPTMTCCLGSLIPPARCRSSCAGRDPAGPEPGWLQRTSLGDEVTGKEEKSCCIMHPADEGKGRVIKPDP